MSAKNVQDYLDNSIYGTPEIKADEKKKYLGTYRERVVFIMTLIETEQTGYNSFCQEKFQQYANGTLLINANLPLASQNKLIKTAQQSTIDFRMVDTDETKLAPDDIVIVFSVDTAIDLEDISVKKEVIRQRDVVSKETPIKKKKTSFFKRLL